jgi:hypothetical protein
MSIDLLTPEEVAFIQEDFKSVVEDCDFPGGSRHIIYRHLAGSVFNPATGTTSETVVDTELKGFLGNHSAAEIANSGGVLNVGDIFFLIPPCSILNFPKPDDRILEVIGGTGYVKLTQGSAAVVGYNTTFDQDGVQGGDTLVADEVTATVKSVSSDGALILKANWSPATIRATQYRIYREFEIVNRIVDPLKALYKLSVRRAGA